MYLVEKSESTIELRVISKSKDVPYCDCFSVEEQYIVYMPPECVTSSVLRVSMNLIWHKSTMMKSIITSNSAKESKDYQVKYAAYIKKNGHIFKEKKKDIKLNHGIEKASIKNQNQN